MADSNDIPDFDLTTSQINLSQKTTKPTTADAINLMQQ